MFTNDMKSPYILMLIQFLQLEIFYEHLDISVCYSNEFNMKTCGKGMTLQSRPTNPDVSVSHPSAKKYVNINSRLPIGASAKEIALLTRCKESERTTLKPTHQRSRSVSPKIGITSPCNNFKTSDFNHFCSDGDVCLVFV